MSRRTTRKHISPGALQSRFLGREWEHDRTAKYLMEAVAAHNSNMLTSKVCKFLDRNRQIVNAILAVESRYARDSLINMYFKTVGHDFVMPDKDIKKSCIAIVCRKLVAYRTAMTPVKLDDDDIIKHTAELDFEPDSPDNMEEIQRQVEETRQKDFDDIKSGKLKPEDLHFIPPDMARKSKPVFPKRYQKS